MSLLQILKRKSKPHSIWVGWIEVAEGHALCFFSWKFRGQGWARQQWGLAFPPAIVGGGICSTSYSKGTWRGRTRQTKPVVLCIINGWWREPSLSRIHPLWGISQEEIQWKPDRHCSSNSRLFAYTRQQIWGAQAPATRCSSELQLWQVQLWHREAQDRSICASLTLSIWGWTHLGLHGGILKLHLPCSRSTS